MKAARIILNKCLELNSHESCLILTDGTGDKQKIAENLFKAAKKITDHAGLKIIPVMDMNGQEPDQNIAQEMVTYDVIIILTDKSLSHTKARQAATDRGARVASMPGITKKTLKRAVDVNYDKMIIRTHKIADALNRGRTVQITAKIGTNLTFSVAGRKAHGLKCGLFNKSGYWGNLPDGEAFIAPIEGSANGVYVVDASQAGLGAVDEPIWIKVRDGLAYDIENTKLKKLLDSVKDPAAYNIAEFGIGTNNKAKISGSVLEDEKVLGTCHIALGSNFSFGGRVDVPVHLDGIIKEPDIFIDRQQIMRKGKLKI